MILKSIEEKNYNYALILFLYATFDGFDFYSYTRNVQKSLNKYICAGIGKFGFLFF